MSDTVSLEVLIQIRDEIAGLNRARTEMQGAKKDAEGLGSILRQGLGIGTGMQLAVGAVALLKSTLQSTVGAAFQLSEEIQDQSQALGMSARAYQVYRLELMDAGVESSRLSMAVTTQTNTMAGARDIASSAATAYRILGLDLAKLEQLPVERRLELIARATLNAKDKTQAFDAAGQILGSRGLPQLLNALRGVATDGYDKVAFSAEAAGKVMDRHTAEQLDKAKKSWEGWKNWLVVQSASLVSAFIDPFGNTPSAIIERRRKEREAAAAAAAQPTPNTISPLPLAQSTAWRQAEFELTKQQNRVEALQSGNSPLSLELYTRERIHEEMLGQIAAQEKLLALAKSTPLTASENQHDRDKLIEDLRHQILLLQKKDLETYLGPQRRVGQSNDAYQRVNDPKLNPDYMTAAEGVKVGMQDFVTSLGSMGQQTAAILQNSLGAAINSIGDSIWEGMKGTQSWGDAFTKLGEIGGRMLTQIIAQMLVVKAINFALGMFGFGLSGNTGPTITKLPVAGAAAGGGDFVTRGPTTLLVGDNPGGIEHISVRPVSGVGQTRLTGHGGLAMAGGGNLLAAGKGREMSPIAVTQNFYVSTGVADTVRAELFNMMPSFRMLAVDATREAMARGDI